MLATLLCVGIMSFTSLVNTAFADGSTDASEKGAPAYGWFEAVPIGLFGEEDVSPGTSGSHQFSVRNTSDYALEYELVFYGEEGAIPLKYRIINDGEYLLGDEHHWEDSTTIDKAKRSAGTIPMGGKLDLTVEWQWLYDSGDDERDTALGIASAEEIFYVALVGQGRDSNNAPVIVKSDFVEPIKGTLTPIAILLVGTGTEIVLHIHRKKREESRNDEKC